MNDFTSIVSNFSYFPQRLNLSILPEGLTECDTNTGLECARLALSQLENSGDGFSIDLLPKSSLIRCALLGSHTVHYRNYRYGSAISLRNIIERKINSTDTEKYLIANNSLHTYYSFKVKDFRYDHLDFLKNETHAIDFILLLPKFCGLFVFCEDAPACFMSFRAREHFERDFMSPEKAMSIFVEHMDEWQITGSEGERQWLEKVKLAMSPNSLG